LLLERPHAVGELVEGIGLSQPGTSKHLRVLRDGRLDALEHHLDETAADEREARAD
jgi:DNA-binding transcriptional ArsR family regulator